MNGDNMRVSNDATYFDSFRVEQTLKEIKKYTGNHNITLNTFRIQARNS